MKQSDSVTLLANRKGSPILVRLLHEFICSNNPAAIGGVSSAH